ncbi:TetR family transcriptional regulator [Nocardioides pacificus]
MLREDKLGPEVGPLLRTMRQAKGLSLRGLAELAGVSAATLSQIETGKAGARPARVVQLARALDVDPAELSPELAGQHVGEHPPAVDPRDWRTFPPLAYDPALLAALQSFTMTGYHGASVRDIARRCGLSVPGLYHYYPSKQAMLNTLFEHAMEDLLARGEAARAEGTGPVERFSLLVEALTLFHAHRRELAFLGTSELRSLAPRERRRHAALRTAQQQLFDDEVENGVREGLFRTPVPHEAARAVVTMCVAVANWYRSGGPLTPEEIATQYVQFSLGIVGYRP